MRLIVSATLFFMVLGGGVTLGRGAAQAGETLDLTLLAPISGRAAGLGAQMRSGAEAAVAALNQQGGVGGRLLRLEIADDACSPREAVSAVQRTLARGGRLLVGPLCSGAAAAIRAQLAEDSALAVVTAQMDSLTIAPDNRTASGLPVLFRVTPPNGAIADLLLRALLLRHPAGAVGLVTVQDAFGKDIKTASEAGLAAAERPPAVTAEIAAGERDFTAVLTRLRAAGVVAVLFGGYASEAGPFLRQMREAGLSLAVFGPGTLTDRETCIDRSACEGVIVGGSNAHSAAAGPLREQLEQALARPLEDGESYAVTAVEAIAAAARVADPRDVGAMRRALLDGSVVSVTGPLRFAANGERLAPAVRLRIYRNGELVPLAEPR